MKYPTRVTISQVESFWGRTVKVHVDEVIVDSRTDDGRTVASVFGIGQGLGLSRGFERGLRLRQPDRNS